MPNLVDSKGFYKSKETASKNHTLYQNFVENIHNMEHNDLWQERLTNENPVNFGLFYREKNEKNRYLLFATNMKRTYENLCAEFTPYQHDDDAINTVSTHGYGGIALPLKIGGHFHVYFTANDEFSVKNEDYQGLSMNIDSFMKIARANNPSDALPSPTYEEVIPDHNPMICFMESIWGTDLLKHFQEMNYKTFYVFYNPNLGNTCTDKSIFDYLRCEIDETFQNQFIQQLQLNYIQFFSSYKPGTLNQLPEAFYQVGKMKNENNISIQGIGGAVTEEEIFAFMRPIDKAPNVLHWKYGNAWGRVEFVNGGNETLTITKSSEPIGEFQPDFQVRTGQLSEDVQCYSDSLKKKKGFSLEIERDGIFADGIFVDVGDIPLTSKPIPHNLQDSSHLIGNKRRRTFVKIYPNNYREWKDSIYPTEMKEDGSFTQGSILVKAINFVTKLYNSSRPKNNPRKNMIDLLDAQRLNAEKTQRAAQHGNEFEFIHMNTLLNTITNSIKIHGDSNIKREYKLTGQGIDHILSFNNTNITILIQDKLQQRCAKDKINSFVDSVKEFRNKYPDKKIYSLFINGHESAVKTHFGLMDELICNNCILRKSTETEEQFKNRIKDKIEEIRIIFS